MFEALLTFDGSMFEHVSLMVEDAWLMFEEVCLMFEHALIMSEDVYKNVHLYLFGIQRGRITNKP